MFRVCCCMGVVLMLTTFAVAESGIPEKSGQNDQFLSQLLKELISLEKGPTVDVIQVEKMPQSDAIDAITSSDLKLGKIKYGFSDTVPAGHVMQQEPKAGTQVEPNSKVDLVIAQTEIAIQSYVVSQIEVPEKGEEASGWGQMIVHRAFDAQLPEIIQHVPIFTIKYEGKHHAVGINRRNRVEARAKCIAERLSIAWDFMDRGGYLFVAPSEWIQDDDWELWRLQDTYRPDYEEMNEAAPEIYPAIYVSDSKLGTNQLRIMTIYPEDAKYFQSDKAIVDRRGRPTTIPARFNERELAEYLVALLKAHHLLFCKMSTKVEEYDKLEISKTREGRIFKEIAIRLADVAPAGSDRDSLKDALARIAMSQRDRLVGLAKQAPRDWRQY